MTKVKLTLKEFKNLKTMLNGSDEDFELACENIKNMDLTTVTMMLFAKSLTHFKRENFVQKFAITEPTEWNKYFYHIKKLVVNDVDKELILYEITEHTTDIVKKHYKFINNIDIKLRW